ncbi:hypothetical protein GCM10009555_056940 [Acrocarpospora macrocephala]|uniref:Uncharacterized protein n=1 Tax=Acrocarpospora macrocephala TaxID=150177 RepID=A0A5M3WJ78_9ACTN|nr:hypothetical protein Amac_020160 [Acrocarpospora macrocephala]
MVVASRNARYLRSLRQLTYDGQENPRLPPIFNHDRSAFDGSDLDGIGPLSTGFFPQLESLDNVAGRKPGNKRGTEPLAEFPGLRNPIVITYGGKALTFCCHCFYPLWISAYLFRIAYKRMPALGAGIPPRAGTVAWIS